MYYEIILDDLLDHAFMYSKDELKLGSHILCSNKNSYYSANVLKKINKCDCDYSFIRILTDSDLNNIKNNKNITSNAILYANKVKNELKLDMHFIDSFYTFDKKQMFFLYTSSNRIDFRTLAKRLADRYKTRIELRQIGVRDKAKRVGGLGPCGLFLCCNSFLTDFSSVSINMAKNQNLALNPSKINGVCGRLLCCLNYENDNYTELKGKAPRIGANFRTKKGMGKVIDVDLFKKTCTVEFSDKTTLSCSYDA